MRPEAEEPKTERALSAARAWLCPWESHCTSLALCFLIYEKENFTRAPEGELEGQIWMKSFQEQRVRPEGSRAELEREVGRTLFVTLCERPIDMRRRRQIGSKHFITEQLFIKLIALPVLCIFLKLQNQLACWQRGGKAELRGA